MPTATTTARPRVRRPADALLAAAAGGVVAVLLSLAHALPLGVTELTGQVARGLHHVPRAVAFVLAMAADVGAAALAVVALVALLRNDARDARNAAVASGVAVVAALGCVVAWQGRHGGVAAAMLGHTNPAGLVTGAALLAYLTASDLVRLPRWTRWCAAAGAALFLTGLLLDDLTFYALLTVPFGAWAVGLLVRWGLRTASVRPTTGELVAWLRHSGVDVATLDDRGAHRSLAGRLADGQEIRVALANRDSRGTNVARGLWHRLRMRQAASGTETLSRRSQLQRQALVAYLVAGAGLSGPRVLRLGELPPETLVLATAQPSGSRPGEGTGPTELTALFTMLCDLHRAGLAHRDLRPENLLVDVEEIRSFYDSSCSDGSVLPEGSGAAFASLEHAQAAASELTQRLDVAQLLVTAARLGSPAAAVAAMRAGYAPDDVAAVAGILQPVALAPWGWGAMRAARGTLAELRRELAGPETDADAPLMRLERFRWRTVLSFAACTVAAYLLVGELSRVDLPGAVRHMNPLWFLVALAGSALTYLAAATNLAAFVPKRLSPVRGFLVQLATAFVGIAMPPTVGHVAVNGRYLVRAGVDEGAIAAAVAVSQVVSVVTTVLLLILIGLLTGSHVSYFRLLPSADLLVGIGIIVTALGLLAAWSRTRYLLLAHVWAPVRTVLPRLLEAVSQPLRLLVGAGANLALTFGYTLALLAALHAVGSHPSILGVTAVYLAANTVGSAAPTPGGVGAVEAVLAAGLTATGIPAHEAIPAVLVFRVATFWLPIPAGWASYHFLRQRGVL